MTIIKCKECGNAISPTAQTCPQCGARVARKPIGFGTAIGIIFLVAVSGAAVDSLLRPSTPSSSSLQPRDTTAELQQLPPRLTENYSQVKSLKLKKGIIKVGMLSDQFIEIVTPQEVIRQEVSPDPLNPKSLLAIKHCKSEGLEFTVEMARPADPGPYRVVSIAIKR